MCSMDKLEATVGQNREVKSDTFLKALKSKIEKEKKRKAIKHTMPIENVVQKIVSGSADGQLQS